MLGGDGEQDDLPSYWVELWNLTGTETRVWRVWDAKDVHEVIAWVETQTTEHWVIFCEARIGETRVDRLRVAGYEPSDWTSPEDTISDERRAAVVRENLDRHRPQGPAGAARYRSPA